MEMYVGREHTWCQFQQLIFARKLHWGGSNFVRQFGFLIHRFLWQFVVRSLCFVVARILTSQTDKYPILMVSVIFNPSLSLDMDYGWYCFSPRSYSSVVFTKILWKKLIILVIELLIIQGLDTIKNLFTPEFPFSVEA